MTADEKKEESRPMVSVVMIAYNNARHITSAIEGVIRQKSDFPIELLISDDASTDNTRDIIRHYASLYPDIVKPHYNESNLGIQRNYLSVFPFVSGKYMAMCDADDYWFCHTKLARQVKYMESHPECAITFHRVINLFEPSGIKSLSSCAPANLQISDLARANLITNMSVLYRRELVDLQHLPSWLAETKLLDYGMHMLYAAHGSIHFFRRPMGVYRQWEKGAWSNTKRYDQLNMALAVRLHLLDEFKHNKVVADNIRLASLNILSAMAYVVADDKLKNDEIQKLLSSIDDSLTINDLPPTASGTRTNPVKRLLRNCRIGISRLLPAPHP